MIIQIYAFRKIDEALAAVEMGVDQVGFVAGDYGLVHGELDFASARMMADALPPRATSVALTMTSVVDEILRMVAAVEPDIVHISTDPEDVGLAAMEELKRELPAAVRLMKAIPVEDESSIALAQRFAPVSDILLLDSKATGFPGVGATGHTHDWSISRRIVDSISIPVILAGGLTSENVATAMRMVRPWGVDSNTSTNILGDPEMKDLDRIAAFVDAVKGGIMRDGSGGSE